ncbi:OstA-like protein [Planobacterium oryzisoli]|uniref:Organic solvent tolerance protein OstA n=1 Tax=Planobacterium oryzisoli TaxID=2771435 RepID=A0A931E940_9FLAO|nr:OstA-like protein [Planobacterium oryzisoli]MBF5028071.1 organic solvent tolerance protein OstA [Planobacterium oryzisoli]
MKNIFLLICVLSIGFYSAQIKTQPTTPLTKDPFFNNQSKTPQNPAEQVELVHSDLFQVDKERFQGNPFFSGNVKFSHKGSILTANEVVLYKEQNFIRAVGNVRLENADGSVITAQEMEYDGNTERGIARKDVVLTDPKQTISTQTLYYDRRTNEAYFNTGGTIRSDGNTMYTNSATYDISSKMIDFRGNVRIDNPEYTVEGINIKQNQNTNTAEFFGPTTIRNKKNPSNYLYTEKGRYLMDQKEAYLEKNSRIYYNNKVLTGDALYFNQITGYGTARGNVTLDDPLESRYLKGGYAEVYEKKDSAMVTEKPYAVKILEKDSIYFAAERILAYQKLDSIGVKKSHMRAYNKARMYKSNAQARADSISFNETDGILHLIDKPILWSGERQVTGQKILAYFNTETEDIDSLKVLEDAFAINKVDTLNLRDEFNQIKGRVMTVYYKDSEISLAQALGNAQAITYADSENEQTKEMERLGVVLSTCGTIEAEFTKRKVEIISCNIGAKSDFYPMSKISKERRFFPDFNWNTKDRIRRWQDIFLDTPNYPEIQYESDDSLYQQAQDALEAKRSESQPARVRRTRK